MKNIIAICLCLIVLSSCKKANPCATPVNFTLTAVRAGEIEIHDEGNFGFTNAIYVTNGQPRESGTKVTLGSTGGTITGLTSGAYDIYLQGNCGGTSNSDWAGPKSFLVSGGAGNCAAPTSLTASSSASSAYVTWNYTFTTLFELEYGPTGFNIGDGDTLLSNNANASISNMTYGTTYDFVVRAKCADGQWGPWSSRFSYYCDFNNNVCNTPSNILSSVIGSTVELNWDPNGMTRWEIGISTTNAAPGSGNITIVTNPRVSYTNLISGTTYYFYVRAICSGGGRTRGSPRRYK